MMLKVDVRLYGEVPDGLDVPSIVPPGYRVTMVILAVPGVIPPGRLKWSPPGLA